MSKKDLVSIISAALVVLIALVIGLYPSGRTPGACDINQEGGCTEAGIAFSIEPRPVAAMRDNVFRVKVDDGQPAQELDCGSIHFRSILSAQLSDCVSPWPRAYWPSLFCPP